MTISISDDRDSLADKLHVLDAELEKARKRLYWLRATLGPDQEDNSEIQTLARYCKEVADEFTKTYRRWNARG